MAKQSRAQQETIERVMHEFKHGELEQRGGRKGDLSRFVEEAVNREVLRQMIAEVRSSNAALDDAEITRIVDEEVAETRARQVPA